jgi:rhodanese-related sulfurtransferase
MVGRAKWVGRVRHALVRWRIKAAARRCAEFYNSRLLSTPGLTVKFILDNWYLFAMALVSGGLLFWPLLRQSRQAGSVSAAQAVQLVNRERAVLIDVSEPAEYAAGHVAGAKSVPLSGLATATDLPKNKALPLVVVCATGSRANRAVAILRKAGFENARALAGGLSAWREANLPVEKSA